MVLEPVELQTISSKRDDSTLGQRATSRDSKHTNPPKPASLRSDKSVDGLDGLPPPNTAVAEPLESWNQSRTNMYRIFATFWSFVIMGLNDASYGPLIPYLETYYGLSYTVVSLVFLSPFFGYNIAALLNNTIHLKFGQRGIAFLGPLLHLIAYVINCLHPPYPVLVISFVLAGLGNGFEDGAWNAWIGAMANANEVLGFLHGFYGLGGVIAPLIATSMITKLDLPWYSWYYVMVSPVCVSCSIAPFL